ncbi:SDR family oxidoreductase [Pararhizobium mangrovi]|uniref:SDR family oxidoreductase n=1 Tax=Pararhizobium mangrovi TaxID=2590452 RepID=A0A506UEH7_9HYPH|nr:SDR family oxidoreductase [Pararhizobium mangrovi]TPW32058.1 SDR family oxidoreductase [Pararhizobium mangrovi]
MGEYRTALVTGGAKRIGRAIVEDLARNGFAVAVHANRSTDEAEALVGSIRSDGGRAAFVRADLTDVEQAENLIARASEALGPVDLLVNSASLFKEDTAERFDAGTWDAHFAIHARAPVLLAQRFAAQADLGDNPLVVNIVDQRVWRLTPEFFSYTLSKSTLWTATQTMAQGLAPRIRVNAIGPGPAMASEHQSAEDFEAQTARVPLERGPQADEFGRTIRYLYDCRSITGQMIALDGGQHLAWRTPDTVDVAG